MKENVFQSRDPNIEENLLLRIPQREAYYEVMNYYNDEDSEREIGIILPVGCGKSGLITLIPFAIKAKRALVVAPGLKITQQLYDDFDPTKPSMFYLKCQVLEGQPYPEPVPIRGATANISDLEEADVVITNIQQLQGNSNRWLSNLGPDFFEVILFDEGHHNVAASWEVLRKAFPKAKIINFSATPMRADGQIMAGKVVYTFPIFRAIEQGYVKRLKAIVLNPKTLKYVREENGQELVVPLEEVRRLGEEDAEFRRSIVTSQETLKTIVDASIRELHKIRQETSDERHKIIAAALNYQHCIQIVQAYRARGLKTDFVHSREDSVTNDRVLEKLKNHDLDVIVQVRKLGEGFDHPYLSVAAVFTIFKELSPFVQFVGRIMRVIDQNDPNSIKNQGTVVFHAGSNIARLWQDFQNFSQADQEFFDQLLLPMEGLDFSSSDELEIKPRAETTGHYLEIKSQESVLLEEIPLLLDDEEALKALQVLKSKGFTPDIYRVAYELDPVPTTKVRKRQAARSSLDDMVKNAVGRVLKEKKLNPQGHDLDRLHLGKTNFVSIKSALDKRINSFVGRGAKERSEFSKVELDKVTENLDSLVLAVIEEVIPDAKA